MESYNIVLLISIIIFSGSSVLFLYLTATAKKPAYSYALIVSIINLLSSMIMFDGQWLAMTDMGEPLFYTRWLGYIASCTLLMYTIGKAVRLDHKYYIRLMYLTGITMLTGALASVATGGLMIGYFVVGAITYALMIMIVQGKAESGLGWIKKYIYYGWTAFPLVFLLSPEGFGIIGVTWATAAYLGLDIFTKILFYLELVKKQALAVAVNRV